MEPAPCDYSALSDRGDTPPCWGVVTLVEEVEMSGGDRVAVRACGGHRGITHHGHYLEEGAPVSPEEVGVPEELTALWDDVPASFFTDL